MRISTYSAAALQESYGLDVATVELGPAAQLGVGGSWGRVSPGGRSGANQHDEIETWVILAGSGDVIVDAARHPVRAATVIQFDPFETHFVENTGATDLVFTSFYWRDGERARAAAGGVAHRRFDQRPVFVFSSAPTPNGDLHLGHLSGPFLAADVYVRFQRMIGTEVWHLTGSDDFQSYVVAAARREGRSPAETAAHYSAEIQATFDLMDIGVDQYTATAGDPTYPAALRRFFSRLVAAPAVRPREEVALFDGETGQYLFEADVAGRCPSCGQGAGGNICEGCREPNSCVDLIEPRATASDVPPRPGTVTRYSVPLHELRTQVEEHHRLGRVPATVKQLADRLFRRERLDIALTHPAQWGVPAPGSDVPGQVVWSWPDLAFSFLHGIESLGARIGRGWRSDAPQPDWKIVHFLGWDGSFFHPILFPALYRLAHPDWNPDIDYHLNEFYLLEASKFSTSRRHVIWGKDILTPQSVDGIRLYLALTRPEGRQTNFERAAYEAFVRDTLVDTWQGWLTDLGERVAAHYDGHAPDAGIWTPEHTAFLARLDIRLSALTAGLGQDGFSLNEAGATLTGMVADVVAFAARERPLTEIASGADEARTAVALELAAAQLLAAGSAPVMPRFAARLAAALGGATATEWPRMVTLVKPGTAIDLAGQVFFGGSPEPTRGVPDRPTTAAPLLPWLSGLVRGALRLPAGEPVHDRTLVSLGMESLQAIALQYQIAEQVGGDLQMEDLLGGRDVAALAAQLEGELPPEVVAAQAEKVTT